MYKNFGVAPVWTMALILRVSSAQYECHRLSISLECAGAGLHGKLLRNVNSVIEPASRHVAQSSSADAKFQYD